VVYRCPQTGNIAQVVGGRLQFSSMAILTETLPSESSLPLRTCSKKNEISWKDDIYNHALPEIPLPPPSKPPTEVLSLDKDTPDHHVPRDPRLIRLTGVHPFNVEPPLTDLFNEGALIWKWHFALDR
jgi:nitrate reductase (NAD(P)H)